MTALSLARSAYGMATDPTRPPRAAEYDAFARVTAGLKSAQSGPLPARAAALHDNRRLWAALAADVAQPGNALPDALRARILFLADFIRQHSRAALTGTADCAPLIEINTAVMRGLTGTEPAA
ncbi:flagellar protein FlaF [Rhodovulum iodosum]|uniref:Flagellar protein FlaF n=1 Tax=Rhodovulum iodosum TaxID=68291 RepID=A0ABV3XRF9_9RHOB|nr:flagellar biosynthesis regulator FlaF [Rhodovulum robiginosum]RSK40014.1 flagellar biosynthesis regulatory protein FlaF [Rhodovulum robiginosum]